MPAARIIEIQSDVPHIYDGSYFKCSLCGTTLRWPIESLWRDYVRTGDRWRRPFWYCPYCGAEIE